MEHSVFIERPVRLQGFNAEGADVWLPFPSHLCFETEQIASNTLLVFYLFLIVTQFGLCKDFIGIFLVFNVNQNSIFFFYSVFSPALVCFTNQARTAEQRRAVKRIFQVIHSFIISLRCLRFWQVFCTL